MKYRKLDKNGDFSFGHNSSDFLVNTPEAVAQAVKTRLLLIEGEWFLDITEGTPYYTDILGMNTIKKYDLAIQDVILETQGVISLLKYDSFLNSMTRALTIDAIINTVYGSTTLVTTV